MSSEILGSAENVLKGNLGGAWDVKHGYADAYTDLGIARRFGGSAAAYSLRDIGAMNGRVVKVRRDVDGQGTDPEEDFSANQVANGSLEDWVNGKLENTLPADVATASAAYSLRKVKDSYSDNAVRIRRTSDSTEVDVAFDSDDKVSSSSAVTNVAEQGGESGSTNATDLNGFLNEEHEITNTGSTWSNKSASGVQGTVNEASSTLIDFTVTALETSGGAATDNMWLLKLENHNNVGIGKVRISLDCTHFDFENGGTVILQPFYDANGDGSNSYSTAISIDGTGSFSAEIEPRSFQTTQGFRLFKGDVELNDRIRIENLKVESLKSSATVHTWYDQTDNNDAIQETATNQPKIAEDGSVLDYINFDGNTFLDIGAFLMNATDGHCFMVLSNLDTDVETFHISNRSGAKGLNFKNDTGDKGKLQVAFIGSGAITSNDVIIGDVSDNKQLIAFTKDSNDVEFFNNGAVVADDGSSRTYTTATGTANTSIGKQGNSSSASSSVKQRIYELITYDTDETDNRFKIESNINNYYSLYNVNGDGFVETWYDQSGNGNDATQSSATSQPKIVSSGSLVTQDGKPSLAFDGVASTGDHLTITKPSQLSTDMSILTVINFIDPDGSDNVNDVFISQAGTRWWFYAADAGDNYQARSSDNNNTAASRVASSGLTVNTRRLFTVIRNNSSDSAQLRINGSLVDDNTSGATLSITSDDFTLGRLGTGTRHTYGNAQEVIFFGRAIESDASELETDINNYYDIY